LTTNVVKEEQLKPTSIRIPLETMKVLDLVASEREVSRSKVIVSILDRYASAYRIEPKPLQPNSQDHYALIAPTLYGKTFMAKKLFVPACGRRIIALDPHNEYGFSQVNVSYDRTAPATQNPLFEMFSLSNIWSDVDRISRDLIRDLQSRHDSLSVRFDVVDPNAESMIVTEVLKRMTQTSWNPETLLIVEEASKFDCRAVVSRGRHCGIQALLLSQYPLADEVMSNTKVLLGPISARLIEDYDPLAASAILDLREHEFLWEEAKGSWHKFRLEI